MKKGWETKSLGDLSDLITKGTTPTSIGYEFVKRGINFVKVESISAAGKFIGNKVAHVTTECHAALKRSQLEEGDILFSIAGALGRTALVTKAILPANTNQALAIIRLKADAPVARRFVATALETGFVLEQIEKVKGGVAQLNLSLAQVRDFEIPVPPLAEQQRIVGVLDEAFAGLATAQAHAEKNLQNARALFESHLQSVFAQRGNGWVERRLGDVFSIGSSKRIRESEWKPSGIPFYGGKEIVKLAKDGYVVSKNYISEGKYDEYASKFDMPKTGDLLITARGTIGVGYVVQDGDKFYYKDGNIISFRKKFPTNPHFVLYAFRSKPLIEQFEDLTGATVTHLPIERANALVLSVPDIATQESVVESLGAIESETQRLESLYQEKLAALAALKKSLLHQAFSGEL